MGQHGAEKREDKKQLWDRVTTIGGSVKCDESQKQQERQVDPDGGSRNIPKLDGPGTVLCHTTLAYSVKLVAETTVA